MKAYKAFDVGYICRDYKYTNKEHHIKGKVELCGNGFHACLDPHNLNIYYNPRNKKVVYAIVDISGPTAYDYIKIDDKVAASNIKIIKKFDNIKDLYDDFKKNGNDTIKYIRDYEIARQQKEKAHLTVETFKNIIYKKDKLITFPKFVFFGMLIQTNIIDDPNLMEKCSEELHYLCENLPKDDKQKIVEKRMPDFVHRKVMNITKLFTAKEYKEFHTYASEVEKLLDINLLNMYKNKLFKPSPNYYNMVIDLPKIEGDISC